MAAAAPEKVRLGYWAIRGLAQPVRMLLSVLKVPFEDELYEQGEGPEFSREAWLKVKPSMDLPYSNLPYYIDGSVKLTQSQAIMRFIARKYGVGTGLYEGTPEQLAEIDMAMDQVIDLRQSYTRCAYGGMPFPTLKESVLPSFLAGFEKVLASDSRAFLCGAKESIADFTLFEVLDGVSTMVAELSETKGEDVLAAYPALKAYKARFAALPAVADFMASPTFMRRPFNNKVAVWK